MEPFTALMRITPNYKAGTGIALHGINLLVLQFATGPWYRKCWFGKSSALEPWGSQKSGQQTLLKQFRKVLGKYLLLCSIPDLPGQRQLWANVIVCTVIKSQAVQLSQSGNLKRPTRLEILQNAFSKTSFNWNSSNIKFFKNIDCGDAKSKPWAFWLTTARWQMFGDSSWSDEPNS